MPSAKMFDASNLGALKVIYSLTFLIHAVCSNPVDIGASIGTGTFSAGIIGNYAGQLSGAKAVSELQFQHNDANAEHEQEIESHDFSEGSASNSPSLYESLGTIGDHLGEHDFPKDYGASDYNSYHSEHNDASALSESETASASEHHFDIESFDHDGGEEHDGVHGFDEHEDLHGNEIDFSSDLHHEIHSKPVPGIDHGKGAYSYSTTYEFKDPQ